MITIKTVQPLVLALLLLAPLPTDARKRHSSKEQCFSEKSVITFFSQSLTSDSISPYHCKEQIKPGRIAQEQKKVWLLWKKANQMQNEEKLIPLKALSEGHKGLWKLPPEMEPDAQMPYYWGSKGVRPQEGYPLFLYLHGSGPKADEWLTGWKLAQMFDDSPSVYFIPQIPNEGEYYRWWQKAKIFAWNRLFRQALLTDSINPNRLYCFGISEGGYGSQRLAAYYADYLAAAGPMAGGEPLINAPAENYMNIGFSLLTGANDNGFYRNVLTGYTREALDSLEALYPQHYPHRIALIPNRGHGIDYRPTTPWLKNFVRNAHPHTFVWENFEMDGVYRRGFYNLAVLERSNTQPDERTVYSMRIEGNTINLEVQNVTYQTTETDPIWGIGLRFRKHRSPATQGKLLLYLSQELVDLQQEVTVLVNGQKAFEGKVQPQLENLVNSCACFADPERLYPASVKIDIEKL